MYVCLKPFALSYELLWVLTPQCILSIVLLLLPSPLIWTRIRGGFWLAEVSGSIFHLTLNNQFDCCNLKMFNTKHFYFAFWGTTLWTYWPHIIIIAETKLFNSSDFLWTMMCFCLALKYCQCHSGHGPADHNCEVYEKQSEDSLDKSLLYDKNVLCQMCFNAIRLSSNTDAEWSFLVF